MKKNKPKIIVIVGPTTSGKSDLAVLIAKKIGGEIISADSRQVYKGLDIGSGKITKKEMRGIPHYLLDVVSPKKVFSVFEYQQKAREVMDTIWKKNKIPILVGGTGQYIEAVIDNLVIPEVPPNPKLRKRLEKLSLPKLQVKLKKLDPSRHRKIDKKNPVRLIRAIEIATELGKVPKLRKKGSKFDLLMIGLKTSQVNLEKRINQRLSKRMRQGMVAEVKKLHEGGLSWKRMENLGLEYRYLSRYLRGKMSRLEMLEKLRVEIKKYAKRQNTWFKRDKRIRWFTPRERKRIFSAVTKYLK